MTLSCAAHDPVLPGELTLRLSASLARRWLLRAYVPRAMISAQEHRKATRAT